MSGGEIMEGIKFLDEKVPGWRDKLDFDTLNTCSSYNCVLAQQARSEDMLNAVGRSPYSVMKDKLGLSDGDVERYGFVNTHPDQTCSQFTATWKRLIKSTAP